MSNQIIIDSDEAISCPSCGNHFSLDQGITHQTIERYENEFNQKLAHAQKEQSEKLAYEAERKAEKKFSDQINSLNEKITDEIKSAQDLKLQIERIKVEARSNAKNDFDLEVKSLKDELNQQQVKLDEFKKIELELRRKKNALEESQRNVEIELQRKVDAERVKIQDQISSAEAEKFKFKEAELLKTIQDAQRSNEELSRKLEQGSQQLQGEVLELEVENMLSESFHNDKIAEVKKGTRGADVVQTVCTHFGVECGRIIWEAKRAENWSDKWLQKLKHDQQEAKADIAVLVSTVMPRNVQDAFCRIGDVWVVSPQLMRPLAETLRLFLLEANRLKLVNTGKNEKMEVLYNYLSSTQFSNKVRTLLESFESMRSDLEAEKRAMQKIWSKRHTQLEKSSFTMASVVGELQAISQDGLPDLESLEILALPGEDLI